MNEALETDQAAALMTIVEEVAHGRKTLESEYRRFMAVNRSGLGPDEHRQSLDASDPPMRNPGGTQSADRQ